MKLLLASKSPRRKSLLLEHFPFELEVLPPDIDESQVVYSDIYSAPISISGKKLEALIPGHEECTILAVDTVVIYQDKIIGKPKDLKEAREILLLLGGKTHEVISGYNLYHNRTIYRGSSFSKVHLPALNDEELEAYLSTGSSLDKAGAYGIQDYPKKPILESGSYYNVMGLPIEDLRTLFIKLNIL